MSIKSICYVSAQYPPHIGGIERYTLSLTEEFQKRGIDVTLVTSAVEGYPEQGMMDGVEVIRMPSIQLMNGRYPVVKPCANTRKLEKILKDRKFDYVLINTRFYPLSIWGAKFAKKNGISCAVIEHGAAHLQMGKLSFAAEWAEHFLTFVLKKYRPTFVGVSEAACKWSEHFKVQNNVIAHNAVDVVAIENSITMTKEQIREKWHIPSGKYLVVYAGRLIADKGLLQLADAVKQIGREREIYLVLAGDGPLFDELRGTDEEHICCTGSVSHGEVLELLAACDSFCLPSDSEGFPTVVMEAAACKSHVIATMFGGTKEIMPDEQYGVCLQNNTVDDVREGILYAMDHTEERKSQSTMLYEKVRDKYNWKQTAEDLLAHMERS